jgi:hypothetical protein
MTHKDYPEPLSVGCICACQMEGDYVTPRIREREFIRQRQPEVAAALTFIKAADEILAEDGLSLKEDRFIRYIRDMAEHNAKPRTRKRKVFSQKQLRWLRDLYLRVPTAKRTWHAQTEKAA